MVVLSLIYKQIRIAKTNDWIKATPNSKKNSGIKISKGRKCTIKKMPPADIRVLAKPAITFNNVCPAIIFANNRIAKLKGLTK